MSQTPTDPLTVVSSLLDHLAAGDADAAVALLDPEVEWRNTGFPTLRGRRVEHSLREMVRRGIGFEVVMRHAAADGDAVLTDRIDTLSLGPLRSSFRVSGTFRVRDGRVALWDDRFNWGSAALGTLRGSLGALRPGSGRSRLSS